MINLSNQNLIDDKKYIFDYNFSELEEKIIENGYEKFRATQIIHWIINKNVTNFDEMLNLPRQFRAFLSSQFKITALNINTDLSYFDHIIACGLAESQPTSLSKETNQTHDMKKIAYEMAVELATILGSDLQWDSTHSD